MIILIINQTYNYLLNERYTNMNWKNQEKNCVWSFLQVSLLKKISNFIVIIESSDLIEPEMAKY
jgi:hypothetical protein